MDRLHLSVDRDDPVAGASSVLKAVERLRVALSRHGIRSNVDASHETSGEGALTFSVAGPGSDPLEDGRDATGMLLPRSAESFVVASARADLLIVRGSDIRGCIYGVLEMADRLEHASDPISALRPRDPLVGRPSNAVRSVTRLFCSDLEDLPWYRDEGFWRRYLSMLIAQRFGRVSLTLGLGYNYPRRVTDAYLYFAYPFLVSVPGYDVRVPELPPEERDRNLAALRFASDEAAACGLDFQLGLWTHAYAWIDSPDARHTIEGLTPETHAPYCRDALVALLEACPSISGVTFRIHGESGVPERSWEFWDVVFEGIRGAGREVRLDLHAKGLDERTLRSALDTEQPVTVSPKFWAEHMGLPYHQAAIRELERPVRDDPSHVSEWHRAMAVSEGSRPFTRYGYGDFLREDRPYDVVFRLWAGTQRLLSWGDPAFAAAYGRAATIAGAGGIEWCEPLTFKGREGSGIDGERTGYADPGLAPADDWEKYAYAYRLFGRLSYDPDAEPDTWRRPMPGWFGDSAGDAEAVLGAASRILPLVTTAHHPSASNNYFWPELYTDMPIVWSEDETRPHPYIDTPAPRRFGTVSPLDPEVFSSVTGFVGELIRGESSGRSSPLDVADRLDGLSNEVARRLSSIRSRGATSSAELRRLVIDAEILGELGRFFAAKLRAATRFEVHAVTGSREELESAVHAYRAAVAAWSAAAAAADVYVGDLTFGPEPWLRGHWRDRLPAIESDLADMEARLRSLDGGRGGPDHPVHRRVALPPPRIDVLHDPPDGFGAHAELLLEARVRGPEADSVDAATLRYRPMNQALAYSSIPMSRSALTFTARIPPDEVDGRYPLAYAFVVRTVDGRARRFPGLGEDLASQPYHVIRRRRP